MLIAKGCELRKMRYTKDLMHSGEVPKFLSHRHADPPTDTLVDFVEDQGWHFIGAGKHIFQAKHEAGGLPTGGDLRQRLEAFAGIGSDQKFNFIEAVLVEGNARAIPNWCAIRVRLGLEVHAEFGSF